MNDLTAHPLETDDLVHLKEWINSEEVHRNLFELYYPMTLADLEFWYEGEKSEGAHLFRFDHQKKPAGYGMIHFIHVKNRCAEISLIVNPALAGKGYGKQILDHLFRFGFHILNLHKIYLHCAEFNKRMMSLAESRGMVIEGTFRREIYYSGNYYDIYRFGLLFEEYEQNLVDLAVITDA